MKAIGTGKEGFADGAAEESAFRQPQGLALSPNDDAIFVLMNDPHELVVFERDA